MTEYEQAIQVELELLRSERSTGMRRLEAALLIKRFLIRMLRIAAGLGFFAVALYSCSFVKAKTEIPLVSLTLIDLAIIFSGIVATLILCSWAFQTAFGAGPRLSRDTDENLRLLAERRVDEKEAEASRAFQEKERIAARYRKNRIWGLLLDSSIAQRHKWLPWVAWPLGYAFVMSVLAFIR